MNLEQLMMSQTFEQLFKLAQTMPTDIHNKDDLMGAFSTCSTNLIDALDGDRIHFDQDEDKAMILALLTVITDYVMDGNLKSAFKNGTVN